MELVARFAVEDLQLERPQGKNVLFNRRHSVARLPALETAASGSNADPNDQGRLDLWQIHTQIRRTAMAGVLSPKRAFFCDKKLNGVRTLTH